jgi:hypothetical protein
VKRKAHPILPGAQATPSDPHTSPLFSGFAYELPDEREGWKRAEKQGLFKLSQKEIDLLNENQKQGGE